MGFIAGEVSFDFVSYNTHTACCVSWCLPLWDTWFWFTVSCRLHCTHCNMLPHLSAPPARWVVPSLYLHQTTCPRLLHSHVIFWEVLHTILRKHRYFPILHVPVHYRWWYLHDYTYIFLIPDNSATHIYYTHTNLLPGLQVHTPFHLCIHFCDLFGIFCLPACVYAMPLFYCYCIFTFYCSTLLYLHYNLHFHYTHATTTMMPHTTPPFILVWWNRRFHATHAPTPTIYAFPCSRFSAAHSFWSYR